MAAPGPWAYSDWITYQTGSATRLLRLRLHIQEISDRIAQINQYAIKGREVNPEDATLSALRADLMKIEAAEADRVDMASGARVGWTAGRAIQF